MTEKDRMTTTTFGSERRSWEPMSLTRIGCFSDVLRGATGPLGDPGTGVGKRRS